VPVDAAGGNVVVYRWAVVLLTYWMRAQIYLALTSVSSAALPRYVTDGDEFVEIGLLSGDPDVPVASINGICLPTVAEAMSFGHVKSLFR
jgi:hypothetical protein